MYDTRVIAAEVAYYRSKPPHVIYHVWGTILHPAFSASTFVPELGPVVIRFPDGDMTTLDGLDD